MYYLNLINFLFAIVGLVMLGVTLVLYADYFFGQRTLYRNWIQKFVWHILVATTVSGVAISLLYSEYFGFVPCSLCWLQRIALYPQALFSLMAVKTKESVYYPLYSMALSFFGLAVAVYHYIDQMLPKAPIATNPLSSSILPCLADGSADCGLKVINEFGFVTFPFLSAVMFAFLIILYMNLRKQDV